jgi:hypothetical protein
MACAVGMQGVATGGLVAQKQEFRSSFPTGESSGLGFAGSICGEKRISVGSANAAAVRRNGRNSVGVRASLDRIPRQFREENLKEGCTY